MRFAGQIARHAGSVLIGQLAVIGFGVADTMMTGHYASQDLAALSIGASIYVSLYVGLMGVVQALLPIAGHLYGAQQHERLGPAFQQAIYLALFGAVPGMLLLWFPDPLLAITDITPAAEATTREYLAWLAWGLPLALLFRLYSALNQAISRPLLVTLLQIAALAVKVPLNAWFIFGGAGMPAHGAVGCAIATTVINLGLVAVGLVMLLRHPVYRAFRLFAVWEPPRWAALKELLRLGLPTGATYFFEVTAFTVMALFISRLGLTTLAGHQIVANLATVIYMLPLSISVATGAVVAQQLGAQSRARARRAGWEGIGLSVGLSMLVGGVMFLLKAPVVDAYTGDPAVRDVALTLFIFIAVYQVFDAAQVTTAFVLRSYRVATVPALVYALTLWGLGLGGGFWLAFDVAGWTPASLRGAAGFWFANAAGLGVVAGILLMLYQRVSTVSLRSEVPVEDGASTTRTRAAG